MEHRIVSTTPINVKRKSGRLSEIMKYNSALFIVVFCFLIGMMAGALYFRYKSADETFFEQNFNTYFSSLKTGFISAFLSSVTSMLPFAATVFLSGTCMAGAVIAPVIVAAGGVNFGLLCSFVYSKYLLNGIVFNLLMICPSAIIFAFALILSAREALGFSISIARLAFPDKKSPKLDKDFKLYCMRQLFLLLIYALSAFMRALLGSSFSSFFKF